MARELVGDAKPSWQLDIDDLEHQKAHFSKELEEMLSSDDINIATDEDEHEKVQVKIAEIDEKIKKIRADNENKPDGAANANDDGDGGEGEGEGEGGGVPVEVVPLNAAEVQEEWREWTRELPKDPYIFVKGFKRELGGNGTLAHDAETATEVAIAKADVAHKTMQTVRKFCSEDNMDKAQKKLEECRQAVEAAHAAMEEARKMANDLGVPDLVKLVKGKDALLYPPVDKLEYNHEEFVRQQQARRELEAQEAAERALAVSASKMASLLASELSPDKKK